METGSLPPELQLFAAEAVASGRYRDVGELIVAGVDLLRRADQQRQHLLASVVAAEAEGEANGFLEISAVMQDADALIAEMAGTPG